MLTTISVNLLRIVLVMVITFFTAANFYIKNAPSEVPSNDMHLSLSFSDFSADEKEEIMEFNAVAEEMFILFDAENQFHPQFEGFDHKSKKLREQFTKKTMHECMHSQIYFCD